MPQINLSEPSGFVACDSDRMDNDFSDIVVISRSEINFIAKGVRYGKWFAFKGLNPPYARDEACIAMLRKEFELLIYLHHPNIRQVLSYETIGDLGPCVVMEYVGGMDLGEWLKTPRSLAERRRVAYEIADAIAHLHWHGIVHRDLKPENVIISSLGQRAMLIDFGLSDSSDYTILKHPAGTPSYTSREQATSDVPDTSNDIYSFGMVLKKLLPEARYRKVITDCLKPSSERIQSAEEVSRRLKKANFILWPWGLLILAVILAAIFIALIFSGEKPPTPSEVPVAAAVSTEPAVEPASSSPSEAAPVEAEKRTENGVMQQQSAETKEESKRQPEPQSDPPASSRLSKAASISALAQEGRNSLDMIWQANFQPLLEDAATAARMPEKIDLNIFYKAKKNYIQTLEYNLDNVDSFNDRYTLEQGDLAVIDNQLDQYIQTYRKKWEQTRAKKISKP